MSDPTLEYLSRSPNFRAHCLFGPCGMFTVTTSTGNKNGQAPPRFSGRVVISDSAGAEITPGSKASMDALHSSSTCSIW